MTAKKRNTRGKQAGKRASNDLPVSDARAKNARGGWMISTSAVGQVIKAQGDALATLARKG